MNLVELKRRTLVVVDDQPEFLQIARMQLRRADQLVIVGEASSGQAALDLVQSLQPAPDGVLLDVEMPGLDGFETARRLRALLPELRIILTSASAVPAYDSVARRIGVAFLPKRSLSAEAVLHLLD